MHDSGGHEKMTMHIGKTDKSKHLNTNYIVSWGIFVSIGLLLYGLMMASVLPKSLNVHLHEIATEDIQSPIDAVDTQATEAKKQEAIVSTPSAYTYDKNLGLMQVEKAGDLFDTVAAVKKDQKITSHSPAGTIASGVRQIADGLTQSHDQGVSDDTLQTLVTASTHDLQVAEDIISTSIYEAMSVKVGWNDLEKVQSKAAANLPSSVLNDQMRTALTDVLRNYITANYTFDAAATKRNKQDAASSVDNVTIHQGEVIVHKGELVTNDMIRQLRLVGLLDSHFNIIPFIGLFLLTAFITAILWFDYRRFVTAHQQRSLNYLYMLSMVFVGTAALLKIASYLRLTELTGLSYIVPVAVAPLLLRTLVSERSAVNSAVLLSLIGSIIFGISTKAAIFDAPMMIYLLFSALAGALIPRGSGYRPKVIQTGGLIALINMASVLALICFQNTPFTPLSLSLSLGFAALSGFLSVILANGMLPLFESAFHVLSPIRLIELSNPNQPLLRKIVLEAPGTYHHSVIVANLAERACEVIGANGLLARVAAYYHDVGKTKRPKFFVENQMDGVNPHDKISPQLSRTIICAHPYDGAEMLRAAGMPKEIIDIAEQHHGTTLIRYFYVKACESADQPISESTFRYPGPKVQTKEAAVVELADSIEAAVRAMKKPTPAKVQNLIHSIFNDRLSDGQFDECAITLKELHLVIRSIDETLRGVYHTRVEYPSEPKMKMNKVNVK